MDSQDKATEPVYIFMGIVMTILILFAVRYVAGWILILIIFTPFLFIGNNLSLDDYAQIAKDREAREEQQRQYKMDLAQIEYAKPKYRKTVANIKRTNSFTLDTLEDYIKEHGDF